MKRLPLKRKYVQAGFTLVELLVVIGIFTVITAVALINQGKLNSSVLLTNAAYETALAVREAQVYGLGVRKDAQNLSDNFEGEYGVHFDINNPRQIIVYSNDPLDTNLPTQMYNSSINEARYLYQFVNQRGNKIEALCFGDFAPGESCTTSASNHKDIIDITFRRPEPRANFYVPINDLTGDSPGPAYIVVSTLDEQNCKVIVVQKTGQIQVEGPEKGHCITK
jgi:prepilin-type N-terminal cleavage/methylation domain-containing protein